MKKFPFTRPDYGCFKCPLCGGYSSKITGSSEEELRMSCSRCGSIWLMYPEYLSRRKTMADIVAIAFLFAAALAAISLFLL